VSAATSGFDLTAKPAPRKKGRTRSIVRLPVVPPTLVVIRPERDSAADVKQASVFARQACSECAHLASCWDPKVQNAHVEISLLVCRLQAGVDIKRTERRLLELWHPKLVSLTEYVMRKARHLNRAEVVSFLSERALTHAKTTYAITRIGYPLYHLFGKKGVIFFAAQSLIRSSKKVARTAKLEVLDDEPVEGSYEWDAEGETDAARGADAFARLGREAREALTITEWRMYTAAIEWIRWREVLPPLSTLARVLRMDSKRAPEVWASVVTKVRLAAEAEFDDDFDDEMGDTDA